MSVERLLGPLAALWKKIRRVPRRQSELPNSLNTALVRRTSDTGRHLNHASGSAPTIRGPESVKLRKIVKAIDRDMPAN
jgi:hypothetical protein